MDDLRRLERLMACCPEKTGSEADGLPPVSEEDFFDMEVRMGADPDRTNIFPYVRKSENGEYMIDIYISDKSMYPEGYKRFVIREGYSFTEEDEDSFFEYVSSQDSVADMEVVDRMIKKVTEVFPHWHMKKYADDELGDIFRHMYFVCHKSGCREILYKAELANVALYLKRLDEYDMYGSTPEKIIGHNIPLKFLRILNNDGMIWLLADADRLQWNVDVYNAYSDHIIGTDISCAQWTYFQELYDGAGFFAGRPFSRALYKRLAGSNDPDLIHYYGMFFNLKDELDEFRKLRIPSAEDVYDIVEEMESMVRFVRRDSKLDERIRERKKNSDLEYKGKEYSVLLPRDSFDFFHEAIAQGNCVMSYASSHADGATNVLFVRKNDALRKSLVTMEIHGGHVEQVFGRFNRIPDVEVLVFLEEYCRKKRIWYDPEFIIRKGLGAEDDIEIEYEFEEEGIVSDDSLRNLYSAYIRDFRKRMCWPSFCPEEDEKEYRQLEFEDCFPKVA